MNRRDHLVDELPEPARELLLPRHHLVRLLLLLLHTWCATVVAAGAAGGDAALLLLFGWNLPDEQRLHADQSEQHLRGDIATISIS